MIPTPPSTWRITTNRNQCCRVNWFRSKRYSTDATSCVVRITVTNSPYLLIKVFWEPYSTLLEIKFYRIWLLIQIILFFKVVLRDCQVLNQLYNLNIIYINYSSITYGEFAHLYNFMVFKIFSSAHLRNCTDDLEISTYLQQNKPNNKSINDTNEIVWSVLA